MKRAPRFRRCLASLVALPFLCTGWGAFPIAAQEGSGPEWIGEYWVYVGTYTGGASQGIYAFGFNGRDGKVGKAVLVAKTVNPSFLALHPSGRQLYAVNETDQFEGVKGTGGVTAFRVDAASGRLTEINRQASKGKAPCHIVVDKTGGSVLVANYGSGTVAVFPIREDGGLGEATDTVQHLGSGANPQRQQGPHAHSINLDAENRFAVSTDLGIDKIIVYGFDAKNHRLDLGPASSVRMAAGAGPRHFAFHPSGRFAYANNEINSTVTAMRLDGKTGRLTKIQTVSTLPAGYDEEGNSTAEIEVHPSGRFLYVSNRGHDSIAVFQVDGSTGRLQLVENEPTRGMTPRSFRLDPSGRFLFAANQGTDNVVLFRVDQETGRLEKTGRTVHVPAPVSLVFYAPPRH